MSTKNKLMKELSNLPLYRQGSYIDENGIRWIKVIKTGEPGFTVKPLATRVTSNLSFNREGFDEKGRLLNPEGCYALCRLIESAFVFKSHKEGYSYQNVVYLPDYTKVYVQERTEAEYLEISQLGLDPLTLGLTELTLGDYHDKWVIPNYVKGALSNRLHVGDNWVEYDTLFNHFEISSYRFSEIILTKDTCDKINSGYYTNYKVKRGRDQFEDGEAMKVLYAITNYLFNILGNNSGIYLNSAHLTELSIGCSYGKFLGADINYKDRTYTINHFDLDTIDKGNFLSNIGTSIFELESLLVESLDIAGFRLAR